MLKIRLKRLGRKKQPSYRIIVIDSRKKRDGKAVEEVGYHNPINNQTRLDTVRIQKRINEGAQLTKIVKNILAKTINN
uniref:Small ribosomal subunit protein bS16c n=1 Tax=Sarcopeltis skottsbergii TaxID=2765380 RepID=A0A7M1VI16_SARSK|nr:30S ribosomal protein S16 [Sarcopeltis skottsbergii]